MEPCTELILDTKQATLTGSDEDRSRALCDLLKSVSHFDPPCFLDINTGRNANEYTRRVTKALSEIAGQKYEKVIVSRPLDLEETIDMPAMLLWGRRKNTSARTFSFRHEGFEATGFRLELVMLLENKRLVTEPLAGTRSRMGTEAEVEERHKLSDAKEIVEHVISIRAAIEELEALCEPHSVVVEGLLSIKERSSVQHLGSSVCGTIAKDKDGWDALNALFPSITASGIPKDAAIAAIERLESQPRELYLGAILVLEGTKSFEAMLVLRTVFQDKNRHCAQAGAGVISQSTPERELTETEK